MTKRSKDSTWGLSTQHLSTLLSAMSGVTPHEPSSDDGTRLRERLGQPLPLDVDALDSVPMILGRDCEALGACRERCLQDLLLDATTPVAVFETIKAYFGQLANEDPDPVHVVLHYAAIGGALRFHLRKISSRSSEGLAERFGMLLEHDWITPELADHFSRAREVRESGTEGEAPSA